MRNMLLALAALGVVAFSTAVIADDAPVVHDGASVLEGAAEVAAPVADPQPLPQADAVAQPVAIQHQGHVHYHRAPKKRMGPLAKLWELEKRKNAWLKKTFFGR